MLNLLIYWITEREAIRRRKEAGYPRPWTTDSILAEWRFCNVNRCDDRETHWIFTNIIDKYKRAENLWFNLAIARFINWSPALEKIGWFYEWDPARFSATIEKMQAHKEKVYTGAYMICAGEAGKPKHRFLVDSVFTPLWLRRAEVPATPSCQQWSDFFESVHGMGDFMRNQIITDMKYTHHLPRDQTPDWKSFILAGPGTQRGLNRLGHQPITKKWSQDRAADYLRAIRDDLLRDPRMATFAETFADLNNLSNCLCEYDKYCRVKLGEGTPRARYVPHVEEAPPWRLPRPWWVVE